MPPPCCNDCRATASAGNFEIAETQTWQEQKQKQTQLCTRLFRPCQRNRRAQKLLSTALSASCRRLMTCLSSSTSSSNAAASGAASTARRSCSAACKAGQGSNLYTCIKLLPSSCQASKPPTSRLVWFSLHPPRTPCAWPWPWPCAAALARFVAPAPAHCCNAVLPPPSPPGPGTRRPC